MKCVHRLFTIRDRQIADSADGWKVESDCKWYHQLFHLITFKVLIATNWLIIAFDVCVPVIKMTSVTNRIRLRKISLLFIYIAIGFCYALNSYDLCATIFAPRVQSTADRVATDMKLTDMVFLIFFQLFLSIFHYYCGKMWKFLFALNIEHNETCHK